MWIGSARGIFRPRSRIRINGDFNEIKTNLNACIDGLGGLVEANAVLQRIASNDYDQSIERTYQGIYARVAAAVNEVRKRLLHIQGGLVNAAAGDVSELDSLKRSGKRSENDRMVPAFVALYQTIQDLVDEMGRLTRAAVAGDLTTRGDVAKFRGGFQEIVQGVNNTLDALTAPLNVCAEYVERISRGEIPAKITESYQGDFDKLKNNLNGMLDYLTQMTRAADRIAANDLTVTVQPKSERDLLGNAFVKMVDELNGTLQQTQLVVTQVAQSVGAGAGGEPGLAASAQEQSSAVEEVTSNLAHTDGQIKASAESAQERRTSWSARPRW